MRKVKIGILGCGVISNTYIKDILRLYPELEIKAVADVDLEKVKAHAQLYHIANAYTVDELLADSEIEIVVNLTPPALHTELNRRILNSGKNVYCEKPFALTLKEAQETCELAAKQNLRIGSAPDTFMGSSLMTCRKLLNTGWIGKPLYVCANMMSSGVETWHAYPFNFYKYGAGPLYDMGPYYFSALITMFGAAESIQALSGKGFEERTIYSEPHKGETLQVEIPTHYAVLVRMKNGIIANINFSFDIWKSSMPMMEVYGTDGTLTVPDPNMSGGNAKVYRKEQKLAEVMGGVDTGEGESFTLPELYQNVGMYTRGAGVLDLAKAIVNNTENTANGTLATHVIEMITGTIASAEYGTIYHMTTTV